MSSSFRYQQLENQLLDAINSQRLRNGERLPSVRSLCQQHQVSKATVLHALQRLEAQGLIEARPRSGFYVTRRPPPLNTPQARALQSSPAPVTIPDLLLDIMQRGAAFDLVPGEARQSETTTGVVTLNRAISRALRRARGDSAQYYDEPAGLPALREQIALRLAQRGYAASAADLCITAGCQNALFLALMACCEAGDAVAVESPGFYGALQLLQQLNLKVVEIPSSADSGMDMDALATALSRWPVKACIVSPAYSTPAGALMPAASRQRLMALAGQYDLAVIEDDIYADTAFTRIPDPLKAADPDGRVILCSSFSKTLSRDLRLGWIAGGRWHERIVHLKLVTQLASGRAIQQGVADYLADGSYSSHLRRQHYRLRQQRDQLMEQLKRWPLAVNVSQPQGGLTLWAELPPQTDTRALYSTALAHGIVITPGPLFSASGHYAHCLRFSFAHEWTAARQQALVTLGQRLAEITGANV